MIRWFVDLPWYGWGPLIFILGAAVGSFLNVCIYRLPLEKSIIWPGSHCGHCLQPIRWYDNLPVLSYLILRGRCRTCATPYSPRYLVIELATALCFVGLFYLEVVLNASNLDAAVLGGQRFADGRFVIWCFHTVLFCFLLVASVCDLDYQLIPLSLTVTGTLVGLAWSLVCPWPWPYLPAEVARAAPPGPFWFMGQIGLKSALFPWPVWWPLPGLLQPGGNWQTGLATSVAGVAAGTLVLRVVRFLFGFGRGPEFTEPEDPELAKQPRWFFTRWLSWAQRVGGRALGLGDADLMMMAGSFLGWQPVLAAFVVGVFPGLVLGVGQLVVRGNQPFPFGPALALGVVITWLSWARWIGPWGQPLLFDGTLLLVMAGLCAFMLPVCGLVLRLLHGRSAPEA
jgi:leader peptidase (prepilin peptidase)/N-methyltransferase